MLGARVRVFVDSPIECRFGAEKEKVLSKGHLIDVKSFELKNKKVLVFGGEKNEKIIKGRIVSVLSHPGHEEIYVAAPIGVSLYEPAIREMLSSYMLLDGWNISCHFEKSCGAVVFRRRSGNIEYLIIKNKKGNNWGFPKGHVELGETEIETAKREVLEETGLSIEPVDGFRVISEYHPRGKITKQVVFFLAEMPDEEVHLQESEVDKFMWADFGLAQRTFRFNNDRNVLTRVRAWLSGRR